MNDRPRSLADERVGKFIREVLHPMMKELDCHFVICVMTEERDQGGDAPIVAGTGSGVACVINLLSLGLGDQIRQLHEAVHDTEPPGTKRSH